MTLTKTSKTSLVISDVDGTLINQDKILTARTLAAVAKLQEANILFTITSARPPFGLKAIVDRLKLQQPFGSFNGGAILKPNLKIIDRTPLPPETIAEIISTITSYGLDIWLNSDRHWYLKDPDGVHVAHHKESLQFEPTVISNYEDIEDEICKIVGVGADFAAVAECETVMQQKFGNRLSATRSQSYYLDVTHPDANKGMVVKKLSELLAIPQAEIVTIGDNHNDISMFEQSGNSIAMGNASPEVQQRATFITPSNEDEGFAKAIENLVLGSLAISK